MGGRREGRECALQALYAVEMNPAGSREALRLFWEQHKGSATARLFADELLSGILANKSSLDETIAVKSANWSITRMSRIDLSILRMAVFR